MELTHRTFTKAGWDQPLPLVMDSDRTLVLVFGATSFLDDPSALGEIGVAMPRSHRVGCSTSGEIEGTRVRDESLSVAIAKFARKYNFTTVFEVKGDAVPAAGLHTVAHADLGHASLYLEPSVSKDGKARLRASFS